MSNEEIPDNNHRIIRQEVVQNTIITQQHYRYCRMNNLLFNIGYIFTAQQGADYSCVNSQGWIVCCWAVVPLIDLVLKDLANEGATLKLYNRQGDEEYYHIELPHRRTSRWVVEKIFVPEQVVYSLPIETLCSEFTEPLCQVTLVADVKRKITNSLRWRAACTPLNPNDLFSQDDDEPPPLQKQKSLDPDHPYE